MIASDPRIPPDDACVLGPLLQIRAERSPGNIFAAFEDGTQWTWAETFEIVQRTALALQELGVGRGDYVNVWLPNGPDAVRIWFALNYLGAVYIPINLAYRGRVLEHVLDNCQARLIIVHAALADRLQGIDHAHLSDAVVMGGECSRIDGLRLHGPWALAPREGKPPPCADVRPWDTQMVIYTSGTTGPSKGVLVSYFHVYSTMTGAYSHLGADDRFLVNLPLFHLSGAAPVLGAVFTGGSIAMVSAFKTSEFWNVIRQTHSTTATLLGAMATFLVNQPSAADDRKHSLRSVLVAPMTETAHEFADRFGVDVHTAFGMTEISSPLRAGPNPTAAGSCGTPRPGVQVRIVDENDCELPVGEIGELIVRTDAPWAMTSGYLRDVEATAKAWRNGWFHTGDAFRRDEHGDFYFVDRMKDTIRRRGENISSFEVEREVCSHPAVKEAAAIAVPSELAEDEVLIAIALKPDQTLDPAQLIHYLRVRMAHFMVPRYVRLLPELPKTPTHKVMKHVLRAQGVTLDTFDREAAGITIKAATL